MKGLIDLLQLREFLEIKSEYIEIAKGRNQLVTDLKIAKRKIKRKWQLRKL